MHLVNCTPHEVTLVVSGKEVVIEPSGILPRCEMDKKLVGKAITQFGSIPLIRSRVGIVKDLPPEVDGVGYIVSALVATNAPKHRRDLYIVESLVRNEGKIEKAKALAIVEPREEDMCIDD
jgi:hypothetical protein